MSAGGGWERLEALAHRELLLAEDDAADPAGLAEVHAARDALLPTLAPADGAEHEERLRRLLATNRRSEAALRRRLAATATRMADGRRSHAGVRAYALHQSDSPSARSALNSGRQVPIGVSGHPFGGAAPDH